MALHISCKMILGFACPVAHLASAPISISLGCPSQCTGFDFCCLFSWELPPPPFGAVTHFLVLLISSCLLPELMVCCSPPQQQNLVEKQVKLSRCRKISFFFFFFSSARCQPSVKVPQWSFINTLVNKERLGKNPVISIQSRLMFTVVWACKEAPATVTLKVE